MNEEKELPEGWIETALGEICSKPQYGWTTKANPKCGSIRLLRTTDISGGLINWDTVPYCTEIPENLADYKLVKDDIVISRAGSVGVSYLLTDIPSETVFASYLIRFRPLEGVEPRYMAYYLQTPTYWASIYEQSSGIALANVNARKLEAFEIPLASTNEQHRIVAAIEQQFTRLDAAVAALQRARTKLKRYRAAVLKAAVEGKLTETWRAEHPTTEPASVLLESILKERRGRWEADLRAKGKDPAKVRHVEAAVPDTERLPELPERWCWATVEQLASTNKYSLAIGPFGSNLKVEDYRDQGVPLIFVRNIRSAAFDGPDTRYITEAKADELHAHQVVSGDILITKMGDPPGDAYLYPKNMSPAIITADCIKWTLSPQLLEPRFFVNAINSSPIRTQILAITKGVAQLKVSLGRFEGIALPLPPLAEQEQIVTEVERRLSVVDVLETAVEANLKRAERLRQSILREAFAGRLVPQDPDDEPASVLLERIRSERGSVRERKNGTGVSKSNKGRAVKVPEPGMVDVAGTEQVELWEGVGG